MKEGSLIKQGSGSKKNGSHGKRRIALAKNIISDSKAYYGYVKEVMTIRALHEEIKAYPSTFVPKSQANAIDTLFSFYDVPPDVYLTPQEADQLNGSWNYLKELWNM